MALSDAHAQGFALAAILQDERDLGWARAHVEGDLLQRAQQSMQAVRDDADRREALSRLVRAVHGERDPSALPPSLTALLNERTKHEAAAAKDELVALLSRLARRGAGP